MRQRIWPAAFVVAFLVAIALPAPAATPTCAGQAATIVGTPGADTIKGTRGADVIVAGRGDDVIYGLGGADLICAGGGADLVYGGAGTNTIYGQDGPDRLVGGPHRDTLIGGPGDDYLDPRDGTVYELGGGGGDDLLVLGPIPDYAGNTAWGGRGRDTVDFRRSTTPTALDLSGIGPWHDFWINGYQAGRTGNVERIHGSDLLDQYVGNFRANVIRGRGGDDGIRGGDGNDRLRGDAGDDTLQGEAGHDVLDGGPGSDTLYGGPGTDACSRGNIPPSLCEIWF